MSNRIQELTGLRCIAVMMVVITHAEHMTSGGYTGYLAPLRALANGDLGVVIFFVLSGFLITGLLQAEWRARGTISLRMFYTRRVLRIWPAFYVYLFVVAGLAATGRIDVELRQTVYAALHVWNYSEVLGLGPANIAHPAGAWYLGHFWTLALEEQFYWFWPPVLLFVLRRNNRYIVPLLILFIPLVRIVSYFAIPRLRGQLEMMFHTGIDPMLVGCYIALNRDWLKQRLERLSSNSVIPTVLVALLLVAVPMAEVKAGGYWTATYGRTIESAIAGLVIAVICVKPDFWFSRLLRTRVFVFVGDISFSLYLWQQLFTYPTSPVAFGFPMCVVEALVAASLSYWLVELPFLRFKDRLGEMRRQRGSTQALGGGAGGLADGAGDGR